MKHKTFLRPFSQMLLMAALLVPGWQVMHAAENTMDWHPLHTTATLSEPYLEFEVNYYNDINNDSWLKDNSSIDVTVGSTTWKIYGYGKDNNPHEDKSVNGRQYWHVDQTNDGMRLLCGYPYKNKGESNFYTIIRVYFTKVYDGQLLNYSWGADYCPNHSSTSNRNSGSGSVTVKLEENYKLSEFDITSGAMNIQANATTPTKVDNLTYGWYLLNDKRPLAEMVETNSPYCQVATSAKGSTKLMALTINKTPQLYFQQTYWPRYTVQNTVTDNRDKKTTNTVKVYEMVDNELNTPYPLSGSGTKNDPFLISTAEDLNRFREMVNLSHHPEISGKLMTDIDYSDSTATRNMIGTSSDCYSGVFDGNGKSIKIHFNATEDYAALFRYTGSGAVIGNLILKGSVTSTKKFTGALVGTAAGAITLLNIVNEVDVNAGIAGDNTGAPILCHSGSGCSITLQNVGYTGNLSGTQATCNGGLVGWVGQNGTVSVTNSFFAPQSNTLSSSSSFTLVRYSSSYNCKINIQNSYYTTAMGTTQGTHIDTVALASGELAWKLNGRDGGDWLQNLGEQNYPTLWNALRVFKDNGNYVNQVAPLQGQGTASDPYLITSPQDLETFRDEVNKGYPALCARLTNDIDMADRYWVPIGAWGEDSVYRMEYTGIFDGDGYTIYNLTGTEGEHHIHDMALIGGANEGCKVVDLMLYNVQMEGAIRAGTIIGRVGGEVQILNCGVNGVLSLSGKTTGGLVATIASSTCTIKNSYTVFSNLCANTVINDNSYCGTDVLDKAATGELCYLLNGNNGKNFHWRQTLGTHAFPVLRDGKKVYKDNSKYYNQTLASSQGDGFAEEMSSSDFKIIHHGGHLYEFILLGGTMDGEGWHTMPDMKLAYKDSLGNWVDLAQLSNYNRETLEFDKDWSAELKPLQGRFIDSRTWQEQPPVFWIRQGNHTSRKYASLLWMAPKDLKTLPRAFRYSAPTVSIVTAEGKVVDPEAPTDGQNSVILLEPYVDPQSSIVCGQSLMMTTIQPMFSLGIWDATDDKFLSADAFEASTQTITATLPLVEGKHNMVALMYGQHVETSMKGSDTTYVTYGVPICQKPSHTIQRTKTVKNYNHKNILEWAIAFPNDSDVIDGDQFNIYRAVSQDYSDAVTIGSVGVDAYSSTTIENDTTFGWFRFEDKDADAQANAARYVGTKSVFDSWTLPENAKKILTSYKYPERYIFYKVRRTTLSAMFGERTSLVYNWTVLLHQVLPNIGNVKVEKNADWETTHGVKLRVTLPNPYPWDIVDAADRDAVMAEAQKQGFESRMFVWDDKAKIKIQRYTFQDEWYEGVDEAAKTIEVNGSDIKQDSAGNYYVLVSDIQSLPYTHYYYKAIVDNSESNYPICEDKNNWVNSSKEDADACYSEKLITITNFRATQGTVVGQVNIDWDSDEALNNNIIVKRREYQRGYGALPVEDEDHPWTQLTINGNSAIDDGALAAVVNEYYAQVITISRGNQYVSEVNCYGWAPYYGSISGRVKMPNGSAMPGDVTVTVRSAVKPEIRDIYDPDSTYVIMPGFTGEEGYTRTLQADKLGAYFCDSLVYYGSGFQYDVEAQCTGATFVGPTGSGAVATLTLEDATYDYTNIDFTCNDTHQFSGRILYTNSTIPVRDMHFKVNNHILYNADGTPVSTDAMGNFVFAVPRMEVTIQAYKEGHILSGDGYILGGEDGQQKTFTPTHDYDGLSLSDSTTIRLVGRIAAGDKQGSKPIGMGESINTLGDSITLVLQLEGDNTSYTYFNRMNPDETHQSKVFSQLVTVNGMPDMRNLTHTDFQSKRIVIKANNKTGEFCVDLAPARYKVAQMYATGYSNLYGEGEGIQVLDLTDSVLDKIHTYDYTIDSITKHLATSYSAAYNRIYHAPVQLVMEQINGRAVNYFGEKEMTVSTITGKHTMQLAWWDDEEKETRYAFEYPVFQGGKYYQFRLRAYEQYFYNNDPYQVYTIVPVGGKEVSISNGFIKGGETEYVELDSEGLSKGTALYGFLVTNATFNVGEEEALFNIRASVDVNGLSYPAQPVYGYATGEREMGVEVRDALMGAPDILDYIRDPYGSDSYAYRETGTTYNWTRSYEKQYMDNFYFTVTAGFCLKTGHGIGYSSAMQLEIPVVTLSLNDVLTNKITTKDGEFTMTLSERIATSDDPLDVGAMADIYLGHISTIDVRKYQCFNVYDSAAYKASQAAFESGAIRLVAEGESQNGGKQYLVIADGYAPAEGTERLFAYTQKHIMGVLIPNLEQQRDAALRLAASSTEAQNLANQMGLTYYYEQNGEYYPIYPSTMLVKKDTFNMCNTQIKEWEDVIAANEKLKYEQISNSDPSDTYSIAGAAIEHTEEASTYYRTTQVNGATPCTWDVSLGASNGYEGEQLNGGKSSGDDEAKQQQQGNAQQAANQDEGNQNNNEQQNQQQPEQKKEEKSHYGFSLLFDLNSGWNNSVETSSTFENYECTNAGSGYYLHTSNNGYIDMDVYQVVDTSWLKVDEDLKDEINAWEEGESVDDYKLAYIGDSAISSTFKGLTMNDANSAIHNYIFVQRGGASRDPWIDADSTFYYKPDGERLPLCARTLRIDNPKIYVENPVINNQPADEKAVFTIRLSNETEINERAQYLMPSSLWLHLDDSSNPDGAKITIDGAPLRTSMEIYLDPGETIYKTLEVERGGKPYDYEDITLMFTDDPDYWTLEDDATISVHYIPAASPVNISQPADNWLINTLSQVDDEGKYYIPVQIDGFSTAMYDNFDHIELQYKKQTESEDQWVNLCSYFVDDSLYAQASGVKDMITTPGKIANIRFYGENDPVEQKYDLRAVSFCRLGNSYVKRYSKVVSGTKDTRCPEVFGLPKPVDGILSFDDVISLPFTEPIAYNYLDETANFTVQGFTNNSDVDNSVALYFAGSETQKAVSSIDRVLNAMDFSVEMNVKVESEDPDSMVFIAINDDFSEQTKNTFLFGYNHKRGVLITAMNGQLIRSVPLSTYGLTLTSAMTHVGMTYSIQDSTVRFYVGEQQVDVASEFKSLKLECHANGVVNLGTRFYGKMNNIRLWSKALNAFEMSSKYKKRLSQNEANLLDYWPADEASGTTVKDIANGATLTLTDVSWSLPHGYSVGLDHQTMDILSDQALKYTRNKKEDYTISFYFKVDQLDDDANLFAAGSDALEETGVDKVRIRFIDGVLYFISEGRQTAFGDDNTYANDATWHYLAVSVNHAQNKASLFIDGALVNQLDADKVGGVAGSEIVYGDEAMAAHIDQIQMWSMALPASYIKAYYNAGLTGKEKELQIYLPFECEKMNSQGTMYTTFSPLNQVIIESTGEIAGDTVVNETLLTADNKVISPVRSSTGIENLPFTWKSTDNELQITINKANAEINKQQLSLVVRRVEDLNGNPMQNAQMWTTYVNRNVLTWIIDPRTVIVPYGSDTTIVAGFKNTSGRALNYTIDCTSPYITLGQTMGTIAPLSNMATTIFVSDGLAPGVYQAIINLTDEDGLCSALPIYIRVTATAPEWQATTDPSYNQSMNIIAEVRKLEQGKWVVDMCQKDKVAAFIGKECVGVANLSVDAQANNSYLYLTVRGKAEVAGEAVEFRLWSALTGETYILEATPKVTFAAQSIVGVDQSVDLRAYEMRVQTLSLNAGWNWVSLYVDPFAEKGLNNLFSNQKQLTTGDVFRTPFGNTFSTFQSNGLWEATLDNMELLQNNIYQIYAQYAANVEVSGSLYVDPTITLDFTQSEWAQMAYLSEQPMPVRQVLGDFVPGSAKAPAGTIIKGYEDFAIATADGTWRGSLEYLRPGEGYFVRRNGLRDEVKITFTNTSASAPERHLQPATCNLQPATCPTMMPLVATWSDFQEGDMLLAMVGKEVVAVSEATDALFYVSLHANQGEQIQFAKVRHGEVVAVTSRGLKYDAQGQAGTVEQPYLIDFTEAEPDAPIYDILGMKYENLRTLGTRVMIQGNKKVLNK